MSSPPPLLPEGPPPLLPEGPPPAGGGLQLPASGEREPLVLARGNAFCVSDARGDIAPAGARDLGLFHEDTRHLSHLELQLEGGSLMVLSADTAAAAMAQIDLALSEPSAGGLMEGPQRRLHLRRKRLLDRELVEQILVTNHDLSPTELWLELRLGADFADIFEVRGARRARRGRPLPAAVDRDRLVLGYQGLDGERYRTAIELQPRPERLQADRARWVLRLQPGETTLVEVVVQPGRGASPELVSIPVDLRQARLREEHQRFLEGSTRISCGHVAFQAALEHGLEDLRALRMRVGGQTIVGAGIPWFAAPFGRDALITSLELLAVVPDLAVETLRFLAAHQGRRDDPFTEEEPGKILHELRRGEMARTGEIPHRPYYGSIDATPLWLVLLGEVDRWLGDRALVEELLPPAERALAWLQRRLDAGDGLLRYARAHREGLEHQGWKDSHDGISRPDGTVSRPPIALVEVQGYAIAALEAMARLRQVHAVGEPGQEEVLRARAAALRQTMERAFWIEDCGYYALALDGEDRQVRTITSNPGHLLFTGAITPERGDRVVDVLMSDMMWSGWGVRTLGRGQAAYDPLSYHKGSVWPHDNALCALGAAAYGRPEAARRILEGLHAASAHFRRGRLPELFCGLERAEGDFLVRYPVSCAPQAWASAAFFLLLQACLGLRADALGRRLIIRDPRLPAFLSRLELQGLRVGRSRVSLRFSRDGTRTHADVLELRGGDGLRVQIELG